ncbi:choline ABC transporter ATP-binding protein [Rhodobacteraceae bacterium RKSG542]|uniref:choline ABC transporter ATP-binding protein n=1 Tax=Pseudovibrio flavus TaxID=2529854 RepID=UPI003526DCCA|nr:choline ABC transporter ATP-binding protein [Pseudovibrio flavus]
MNGPILSFKNVDIVFGDKPKKALPLIDKGESRRSIREETGQTVGVAGANFDVQQGEVIVLMGLSGSGKSSLLRSANGLNKVTRGKVEHYVDGKVINPSKCSSEDLRWLRRNRVTMVFQQFALLPWRTVRDNVGFGLELAGIPARERRERVDQQLELVGLTDWADKSVEELSGGMQQRVGLARAFATNAPILLMDEPFSALDPLIRSRLQDELLELQSKLKKTILFVSHNLDEAAKIGSRIAIMEGGRVIQIGTASQIIRAPADNYVRDFIGHMNPLTVLKAQDIMSELSGDASEVTLTCSPEMPLADVVKLLEADKGPILVIKDEKPLGIIRDKDVLNSLT